MLSNMRLVKIVKPFINENTVLDVPVKINGVNYIYEYGLGWKLDDFENIKVRIDWSLWK